MNRLMRHGRVASIVAAIAMIAQPPLIAFAAAPTPQPNVIAQPKIEPMRAVDVALDAERGFSGQVVDMQGRPAGNIPVTVSNAKRQWNTVTDADGNYRVADLRGGAYLVRAGDQLKQARAWAPGTAPPSANRGLMMVHGNQLIRGQAYCGSPVAGGMGGLKEALSHPLVIGGIIAAAIAIPVAIHNSDDDPPAS